MTHRLLVQPHREGELVRRSRRQDMCGIVPKKKVDNALAVHVSEISGRKKRRTGMQSRLSGQHKTSRREEGLTEGTLHYMRFLPISDIKDLIS
jgi:hypothetical protein